AIPEGDFPHDYLGLKTYYPDINYFQDGDEEGVSRILPFEGDVISGAMHEFLGDSLFLNYDPNYEIDAPNWLDGVDPVEGAAVSYRGVTGILDGEGIPQIYDTLNTAVYYELPNGSKTAFFGFDVLSLNTMAVGADTLYGAGYHWVGMYPQGPIPQALLWMNAIVLETEDSRSLPEQFALLKVYPNPFNPATTIEFSVPRGGLVTLTVYDLLGREVETILSERMDAGYHAVQWNAGDVSSGIYVVTMEAEGFRRVRKLTVLK
ncbi:MAG: T9SS type A sorting domain-containing protein, partial [Fidelibacterota bacterium]